MSEDEDDRPIERKFVFISVTPTTRKRLNDQKHYGDTYSSVINRLIDAYHGVKIEDYAAQNIDDTRDENG